MIRRITYFFAILIMVGASECFAENYTFPVSNQCITRVGNYTDGLQRLNCVDIEIYQSDMVVEAFPDADFHINVRDTHPDTYAKSARCPDAKTVLEKIVEKCSIKLTPASSASVLE